MTFATRLLAIVAMPLLVPIAACGAILGGTDVPIPADGGGDTATSGSGGGSTVEGGPDSTTPASGAASGTDAALAAGDGSGGDGTGPDGSGKDASVSCNAGLVPVNGTCVCDMNGTFASQFTLTTSWSGISDYEDGANVPSTQWALRTQTYDSTGSLVIETTPCGGTTIDMCQTSSLIGIEAEAQFLPGPIFGLPTMPVASLTISLPNALQGKAYTEPQSATLLGISLTDPLGAWPAAAANIGPGTNQTNGATWVDGDNDGSIGLTRYAVPPGGIASTTTPFPIQSFATTSSACPRNDSSAARDPYAYLPGISGATLVRIKRLYVAQRVLRSMTGTITTCDTTGATLIEGALGGPDSGQVHVDERVGGCVEVSGTGEIACSSSVASEFDGQTQALHVTSGNFILKRVAQTATCADVRGMTFP